MLQNYQKTSNTISIVAFCGGLKCPRKIHFNTQWWCAVEHLFTDCTSWFHSFHSGHFHSINNFYLLLSWRTFLSELENHALNFKKIPTPNSFKIIRKFIKSQVERSNQAFHSFHSGHFHSINHFYLLLSWRTFLSELENHALNFKKIPTPNSFKIIRKFIKSQVERISQAF